jgi:ribose/xylose/arabinose/galactoside ABC-type transport system permease subunit
MTNMQFLFWTIISIVGFGLIFGILFAFVAAIAGFLVGLAFSIYYEQVLGIGNPQGPLLFLLTAPVGLLAGLLFGAWKGVALTRRFKAVAKSDA